MVYNLYVSKNRTCIILGTYIPQREEVRWCLVWFFKRSVKWGGTTCWLLTVDWHVNGCKKSANNGLKTGSAAMRPVLLLSAVNARSWANGCHVVSRSMHSQAFETTLSTLSKCRHGEKWLIGRLHLNHAHMHDDLWILYLALKVKHRTFFPVLFCV